MLVSRTSERNTEEIERQLQSFIAENDMIVQGLRGYDPFLRLVDKFRRTNDSLNDSWHLFTDPVKFNEARVTKYAAMELINCIENLESDIQKARIELAKIRSPDEFINKDVDNG